MKPLPFALALFAVSLPAFAQTQSTPKPLTVSDRKETFGAVLMPPALPAGATAAYGFVGAQEVGGGYRQGMAMFELEGRARFNYFHLAVTVDGIIKYRLLERDRIEVAPSFALGLGMSSGSRYIDARNFPGLLLHLEPGITGAYRVHDTLRAFALVNVPLDLGLTPTGGYRFMPLVGGGVEFYVGEDLSVLAMGAVGPDVMRQPAGFSALQVGYSVKLGVGYRIF